MKAASFEYIEVFYVANGSIQPLAVNHRSRFSNIGSVSRIRKNWQHRKRLLTKNRGKFNQLSSAVRSGLPQTYAPTVKTGNGEPRIKAKGTWKYLDRVVDEEDRAVTFLLTSTRFKKPTQSPVQNHV
jgi:hypothetical protein